MNQTVNFSSVTTKLPNISLDANSSVFREREILIRMGDELDGVYRVNSGTVKLYQFTEAGEEHIIRFCLPGDIFGLGALADGVSKSNAEVLDIANITFIPRKKILSGEGFDLPNFISKVTETLSKESEHSMMLSQYTASRRLAWFLVEFSENLSSRGMVGTEFSLPMIRADIAKYLGVAIETISRELTHFCKQGLLKKRLKHFEILDLEALKAISKNAEIIH